jgi:formate-dependent nitrite reductase membrane component NrfD
MSLGSWTLASFGALSGATAGAQLMSDRGSRGARTLASILGVPAAAAGAVMSVYTGVLVSATSVPAWAAAPRVLPPLFGTSAMASALAAVTLATASDERASRALTRLGTGTAAVELALSLALRRALVRRHVGHDLLHGWLAWLHDIASVGTGVVAPLALHGMVLLTGRRSRLASVAAATAALVGGFMLRLTLVLGGRRSAERPREYFALTGNPR